MSLPPANPGIPRSIAAAAATASWEPASASTSPALRISVAVVPCTGFPSRAMTRTVAPVSPRRFSDARLCPTAGQDGMTTLPGFTGTRMFVTVQPLSDDEEGPTTVPGMRDAFVTSSSNDAARVIVRVPVPPGNEFGRDGAYTTLPLNDIKRPLGASTTHWSLQVVAINDWGEVGDPVVGTVTRDVAGPTVRLETPFTNPVWPFQAHLEGGTEPGATVSVEGVGPVEVDRRGRFTVATAALATTASDVCEGFRVDANFFALRRGQGRWPDIGFTPSHVYSNRAASRDGETRNCALEAFGYTRPE